MKEVSSVDRDDLQRAFAQSEYTKEIPEGAKHLGDLQTVYCTIKVYEVGGKYYNCVKYIDRG